MNDAAKPTRAMGDDEEVENQTADSQDCLSSHPLSQKLVTVEPVVLLYILYAGCSALVNEQYIYYDLSGRQPYHANNDQPPGNTSGNGNVQRETAMWLSIFSAVGLLPALFALLILGNYCDQIGRKDVILIPMFGGVIKCFATLITVSLQLPLQYLFIGTIIENLCGGFTVFLMAVFSSIADITADHSRAWRIIVVEVALAVGFLLSQIGSGYLIKYLGFSWLYVVMIGVLLIAITYCIFFVHETFTPVNCQTRIFSLKAVKHTLIVYQKQDGSGRRWRLLGSISMVFIICFVQFGRLDVNTLVELGKPFNFTPTELGWFSGGTILLVGVGSLVITRFLQPVVFEMGLVVIGCITGPIGTAIFGLASSLWMLVVYAIMGIPTQPCIGMLRSYASKLVEKDEYGAVFAGIAWCESAGIVVGSIVVDQIYQATVNVYKGTVFFVMVGLYTIPLALSSFTAYKDHKLRLQATQSAMSRLINEDEDDGEKI